jgi:dTDP-4-dehydrorhamnose reductase
MKILVLGINGMLGHKAWQVLRARFGASAVFGAMRQRRSEFAGCELFAADRIVEDFDARDAAALHALLERVAPQVVVNCIGVVLRRPELDDPVAVIEINSLLPHRLAAWCGQAGARLIHISTDCVFRGERGGYTEGDPPDAIDLYGRSKALGEAPGALTLRTSIVGRELRGARGLLEWFLSQRGGRVQGYTRATWSGVSTLYLAELIATLIERFPALAGLYHVAGESLSKYDLLRHFDQAFGTRTAIVPDEGHAIRRDLDGSRFQTATGLRPPPWREMAAQVAGDATPYAKWRNEC